MFNLMCMYNITKKSAAYGWCKNCYYFSKFLLAIFSSVFSVIMSTLASFLLFRFRWYQFPFSFLVLIYTLSTTLWQCTRCLVVCTYRGKIIVTNEFRAKNWKVKSLEHFCEKLYACQLALKRTLPFFLLKNVFSIFSCKRCVKMWKTPSDH